MRGVSRRVVLLVVMALALAGGGIAAGILLTEDGSSGGQSLKLRYSYPQKVKDQFLDACQRHSQQSTCECIVRAYEATMPYGVYRDIARGGVRLNNRAYFEAFTHASSRCTQ